jgi:hypothetical protein
MLPQTVINNMGILSIMLPQTFLGIIVFLQFSLALLDHMVTGVLAKGLPPDGRFHAYSLSMLLVIVCFCALVVFTEPNIQFAVLKVWTVLLTWVGGVLDWFYFLIDGKIPEYNFVWHWMPKIIPVITHGRLSFEHPTTVHWGIYTAVMWIPNIICWSVLL